MSHRALVVALVMAGGFARADEQVFAPGTAQQNATVVNTGINGLCETTAAAGDIQLAALGQGTPFRNVIRCGANLVADTAAAGDDRQLVAVGRTCSGANTVIVDSGEDGIANTTAVSDDTQVLTAGTAPSNTACVIAGGNGLAETAVLGGDDAQVLAAGTAAANTGVVLCGDNLLADTTANNALAGDDVQVLAVGAPCATASDVVIDSGANGIAESRAEGVDLFVKSLNPVRVTIGRGLERASRLVKLTVQNREFGAGAPAFRAYTLRASAGSCPSGTVTQIDADTVAPGLQVTGNVPLGGTIKAAFVVTAKLQDFTTADSRTPARCTIDVEIEAADTAPALDDAGDTQNNETTIELEVNDRNDQ